MMLRKVRIAIPTKGKAGLDDFVSDVFGKAKFFTIIDIEDGTIQNVKVIDNPAASYEYGAGPIAVKSLVDRRVDMVIAAEFGPCVSTLLDQHEITRIKVSKGARVSESVKNALSQIQK
ncbi:NifB/NifX family molybdenum-iron cluster-binding protein [Candidatus Bathyarchaeota archaeon]|nr:NifB/NifX family molybdenum-iron cluster-binding protein [Candidatus Bathyarchaeota archaeon]